MNRTLLAGLGCLVLHSAAIAQTAPPLRLTKTLQIGREEPNYDLTWIGGVQVADDGSIFVSQPTQQRIRVYNSKGVFIRTIGRDGSGPGEFRAIDRLDWSPRAFYVLDRRNSRLTQFTSNGTSVIRTYPPLSYKWGASSISGPPFVVLDNGQMLSKPDYPMSDGPTRSAGYPLSLFSSSGKFIRDVTKVWTEHESVPVTLAKLKTSVRKVDATSPLYDFLPRDNAVIVVDRSITPSTSSFTIRKVLATGDVAFEKTYSVPTAPVTQAAIDREIDRMSKLWFANVPVAKLKVTMADAREIYTQGYAGVKYQTPIEVLVTGRDGTMWLRRGSFGETHVEWLSFDRNGVATGTITLPAATRVLYVSSTAIWTAETDEDDVPSVVRYAVTGGSAKR